MLGPSLPHNIPLEPNLGRLIHSDDVSLGTLPQFCFHVDITENGETVHLTALKLAPPYGVSWCLEDGVLCDCGDLRAPYRQYRLHYRVGDYGKDFSSLSQEQAVEHLALWQKRILLLNNRMVNLPEAGTPAQEIMDAIGAGFIPMADEAIIPTADRGLIRLLLRLGAEVSEDCIWDLHLPWIRLVQFARDGTLVREWLAAELEDPLPPPEPAVNRWTVDVSDLDPAALFATFYNNAPTPGAGSAVAAAHAIIDAWQRTHYEQGRLTVDDILEERCQQMSVGLARKILEEREDNSFDYFNGRRMKLWLGSSNQAQNTFDGESFDQCAFPGAARFLVERLRRSGLVSQCLEYSEGEHGQVSAIIIAE